METIKVIAKEIGKPAKIRELENSYEARSGFIGNLIEFTDHPKIKGLSFITDEEFLLSDLPATVALPEYKTVLGGNCLIVAVNDEGRTVSLTEEQAHQALRDMREREFNDETLTLSEVYGAMSFLSQLKQVIKVQEM